MIEIGRSLPNLTDPMVTTGAASSFAFKGFSFVSAADHAGPRHQDQPRLTPEYQGCVAALFNRGERRRHQQLADDVVDDLAVLLALGAAGDPVGIGLECG